MKLVALQKDSLKNRKYLRCESKTTDAHSGQGNKAQNAGDRQPSHLRVNGSAVLRESYSLRV